jgi:hypothetical protein
LPDDHETWGRRSARVRGLGLPKESVNGQANRRLIGDERAVALTSARRKKQQKGVDISSHCPLLYVEEREGWGEPLGSVMDTSIESDRQTGGGRRVSPAPGG